MDADPNPTARVRVERVTEPFSGMPLFRVSGACPAAGSRVEVRYDGETAIRVEPTRLEFGTQLPVEPARGELSVVLVGDGGEHVLYRKPLREAGTEPPLAASGH